MATDLEQFISEPDSGPIPSAPSSPAPVAANSDILDFYKEDPDPRQLSYAVSTGRAKSPDEAAKVLDIQQRTGMPASVITSDPKKADQVAGSEFDAAQYQKDHPTVSDWLKENEQHPTLAQNDLHNLGYLERLYGSVKNAYQQTKLTNERSGIGVASMLGTVTDEQRKRLQQIDSAMETAPDYGMTGVSKIPGLLVDFAVSKPTIRGLEGAAVGLLGGIPEIGAMAGFAGQGAIDSASHTYLNLEKKGVDRKTALALSLISGEINGALMLAPIGKITGLTPGLEWLQRMGVSKVLESPTVRNAIAKYGTRIIEDMGVMGAMSGASSMVSSISEDIGELHKSGHLATMNPGALLATFFRDENLAKAKLASQEGALTGGAIGAIGGSFGFPKDLQMARDARARAEVFKQIGETVKNSEVFQKAPQKTQEIVQRLTKDGPLENGFVPMESWNTYWQEKKVDPREAAEAVTGDTKEYDDAMRTGTDLRIPMDKYAVTLAPTEHNTFFQNELRTNPNEMNAREADEYLKVEMKAAKEKAKPGPGEEATASIKEDIQKQLQATGYSAETAATYAKVYESAFGALGERAGVDPLELYQRYGLNIQRAETIPTDEMAVKSRAEGMAAKDQERFDFERSQFDQWRELLKAGVKPVEDATEEYLQIPNWAKNKNGRGMDEYRMEAIEKGMLQPGEDIFQKIRSLEAPAKGKSSASFMEAARQQVIEEKKQEKPGFFQTAIGKVKTLFQSAYHGTPHEVDKFSLQKIGTGEGVQSFGWGLYFASKREVAEGYREKLAGPIVTKNFRIGDFQAVSDGKYLDYSPKQSGDYASTRASIIEDVLIDQAGVDAAYSAGGENAVKKHILEIIDDKIAGYKADGYVEGQKAAMKFREFVDKKGVKMDAEKPGNVYEVDIPDDNEYLNYDKKIKEQESKVKESINKFPEQLKNFIDDKAESINSSLQDLSGREFYDLVAQYAAEHSLPIDNVSVSNHYEATSRYLSSLGIPGVKYLDKFSRGEGAGTSNYVIFDDRLIKIRDRHFQGNRGFIQFGDQKINISLLKNADLSTFLHETGHLYLNIMGDLSKEGPEQIKADYAKILDFIGAKDGDIKTEHHEKFAQSFEQYLMEGKAPSEALRAPFQRFRAWLLSVYRNVKELVTLTPEIREVFDRMLATDDEINATQVHQDMAPLFPDPKSYGLTDAKAEQYQNALDEAHESAEQSLMSKQVREIQRQTKADWKAEREEVRNDLAKEVDQRHEQQAREFLKHGRYPDGTPLQDGLDYKLSRADLQKDFKDFNLQDLRGMYTVDGGLHPDEAAQAFGYRSGVELLNALKASQDRDTLLDTMADARMKELHGDLMNRPELAEAAMKAVHNTKRARVLQLELEHLASENLPALKGMIRQMTRRIPRLEEVTQEAQETIRDTQNRNIYPSLYLRQEARESRLAGEALARGDVHGAFEAKQRELLNHELYTAASDWKDRQEKILTYFARFDKASTRDRIAQGGRGGETYLEQIDALLDRYDIRKSVSLKEIGQRTDLRTWLADQRMEKGYDVEIPDKFLEDAERMHWKDMKAGDMDDLYSTVKNIAQLARDQAEILYEGRRQALQDVKDTLNSSIRQFYKIDDEQTPPNLSPTKMQRFVTGTKQFATEHYLPEFQFKELDGWEDNGPYWKAFFKPYKESEGNEVRWRNQSLKTIEDLMSEHYTKTERSELFDRISTPEIENQTITKNGLLAMAANHGNLYNLEGMLEGAKSWLSSGQLQTLMEKHMTLKDWEFVQKSADHVNSWWPLLAKLEKERNGIVPKKVEGEPFSIKTADGKTFKSDGWYWPIKWDPEQDIAAKRLDTKETVEDIFGGSYAMAQTRQGHAKARTNTGGRPFSMDFFSVLSDHLSNMQHDLAFRDFVINTKKLLNDEGIRHDISSVQGKEGFDLLDPWLRRIAGEKLGKAASKTEGLISSVRSNLALSKLGYNVSSMAKQFLDVGNGVKELGLYYSAKGYNDVWGKPWELKKSFDFIAERDPEMANRQLFRDRDLREYWKGLPSLDGKMIQAQRSFTMFMNGIDLVTAMPIWMGAYRKAMDGKSENVPRGSHGEVNEADAIAYAASSVRMSKGSFAPGDLPKVMVGSPAYKLWTMFYGPSGITVNNLNRIRGEYVQKHDVARVVAGMALVWFAPAIGNDLIGRLFRQDWGDWVENPAKTISKDIALFPLQSIIYARNIADAMMSQRGGVDTPFSQLLGNIASLGRSGIERISGDKDEFDKQDLDKAITTLGDLTGIPTKKIWTSSEVIYDWMTDPQYRPDNIFQGLWDVARGHES